MALALNIPAPCSVKPQPGAEVAGFIEILLEAGVLGSGWA